MKYTVFRRHNRKYFEVQWEDPLTGLKRTRSTKESVRREAERKAVSWIKELEAGRTVDFQTVKWADVETRYKSEILSKLAKKTRLKTNAMFHALREHLNPHKLIGLDAGAISRFTAALSKKGLRPATIRGHLGELRKVLNWADRQGLLAAFPAIEFPPETGMKGRPITREEFERMVAVTPAIVGNEIAAAWIHLLNGLWLSGLRLDEAMLLQWDADSDLWVDLTARRPLLYVKAHAQKNRTDTTSPITPDFWAFLLTTPADERTGFVFRPIPFRRRNQLKSRRPTSEWVGKVLTKIGKKAGVKVASLPPRPGKKEQRIKWASAHDMRRAFGARWALRVMPAVLKELMRHESIQTTMKFYVGRQAADIADALWVDATNALTDTRPATPETPPTANHAKPFLDET